MAGLDKIVSEIQAEASKAVSERIEKAKKEADRIMSAAEKEANEAVKKINADTETRLAAEKASSQSAVALKKRRLLLLEKQKLIKEVIEEAKEEVLSLPTEQYFKLMEKLIDDNAVADEAKIVFNTKDLERLPSDFASRVDAIAVKKGGKLTISKETRPIDGGFVLVYKGIDRNCSISSIFETNIEALQDKIQKLLF